MKTKKIKTATKFCNHNLTSGTTTLKRIPKLKMVYPGIYEYWCPKCGNFFKYIKDSEGNLIPWLEKDKTI